MSNFFSNLNYSFGNEDWHTELLGLKIKPHHRVICITASGDRPLHVLLEDCQEIVAIDANSAQNHLLHLKAAAMKHLDAKRYLEFLGAHPSTNRLELFNEIQNQLEKPSATFWKAHERLIDKGIIYQGVIEKFVKKAVFLLRVLRQKELQALFAFDNLENQKEFLKNNWNHRLWSSAFKLVLNQWSSRYFVKDPGLYDHLPPNTHPGNYFYQRMMGCLQNNLAKENALISLVLLGTVNQAALPPYLTNAGVDIIRSRLDRLQIITQDVIHYLETVPPNSFDRFSLSDVASYLPYDQYIRLLKAIVRAARPDARFCMRQFLSRYSIPANLSSHFSQDIALAKKLEQEDRAFVYHFTIGTVTK